MKAFHLPSFAAGAAGGLLILLLIAGGIRVIGGSSTSVVARPEGAQRAGRQGARMAERLGMSEEELRQELAAGKTMQQIAQERGGDMPTGGRRAGSGDVLEGSGSTATGASSFDR